MLLENGKETEKRENFKSYQSQCGWPNQTMLPVTCQFQEVLAVLLLGACVWA
jgi:hypothetical protein